MARQPLPGDGGVSSPLVRLGQSKEGGEEKKKEREKKLEKIKYIKKWFVGTY